MKKLSFFFSILCFTISLAQNPCFVGENHFNSENYNEAIKHLELCLKDNPENEAIQHNLGQSYAKLEKWEQAAAVYQNLVEAYPTNAAYHFLYGGSLGLYAKSLNPLKSVGYLSDIKFHLKKAIELDSNHIEARWALVQIYMELPYLVGGSKSTAEAYAEELLKLSPVDGHLAFGFIETYDENWAKAEKHYKKAVKVGQSETTFQKLVEVQLKQNHTEEAKNTLREAYRVTQKEDFKKQLDNL